MGNGRRSRNPSPTDRLHGISDPARPAALPGAMLTRRCISHRDEGEPPDDVRPIALCQSGEVVTQMGLAQRFTGFGRSRQPVAVRARISATRSGVARR